MKLDDFLSKTARSIPASAIRRFFDMASEMKGQVISLSIGEPDFVTPWSIRDAGIYSERISMLIDSSSSGMTSSEANEVCRRPDASNGEIRTSRWTPISDRR